VGDKPDIRVSKAVPDLAETIDRERKTHGRAELIAPDGMQILVEDWPAYRRCAKPSV
jgi:hypothetical protein